ncbi:MULTISPECIES: ABC transporter substrate-binding protein [unclassified Actinotalea]|uniref:ABC transporter substrate-binding protein n=1 Tax=unclassified Actinotalea TaxID=2638618 RepID=UPI0015F3ABE0|nr:MULTISPECIES: extracellular solute-binding protein [unclassified Actinotalea]
MTTFRKSASAGAVLTLALALAACSGGSSEPGGNDEAAAEGDGTLTVWAWDPAFNIYALEEAEKIYQQEHPDFELEIVETPWEDVQTKLTTLAQSGQLEELPDIFLMQNNAFQKNVINYPDVFSDMSDAGIDFSEFPESVVTYSTVDGATYGVPFDNGTAISALRTDVLQEAGYTVEDFTDITWSEYITLGKDVLAKTGKPLLSGQAGSADTLMMMLQSAGASLFDDEGNPTITGNEALLEAIDVYQELVTSGVLLEVNSWDEYIGTLTNGTVAGTINGVWIVGSIQSAADQSGLWDVTNLPKIDDVDGATHYSANGGSSWAVSATGDTELAADFLASTFAGSTELYDTILPASGALANWTPAGESDVYSEPQEFFGGSPIFSRVVEYASEVPSNNTGAYYYEGRDAVSVAVTNIMGGADPESALQEAQSTVEFAMQ